MGRNAIATHFDRHLYTWAAFLCVVSVVWLMRPPHFGRNLRASAKVNINHKFDTFTEQWSPKVIAEMNDYQFKLARIEGDFVWHQHDETDEVFIVIEGDMAIDFEGGQSVELSQGELYVVPRGVLHKPTARAECKIMLVEPRGVINTGDAERGDLTAPNDAWV